MNLLNFMIAVIYGIIQGITEWLPISSTGHLILANEIPFLNINNVNGISEGFFDMFLVVIQLASILAVILIYFKKLNPLSKAGLKKDTLSLWYKVIVGVIPAAVIGLLFDDFIEEKMNNAYVVATTLIIYGIFFIIIESRNKKSSINNIDSLSYKTAFLIGVFQILALIPGTSRSGSTILGATLLGTSRVVAAEFSFFLAIPVMFGASFLKLLKYGFTFTQVEIFILAVGFITSFVVSLFAIKFLVSYIKKHSFKSFGYYRIILGIIVLIYFLTVI
ncbi:MAG: undecaprenyl-diphosphate phosphatase [Ruminococcaceae bacterium]|nr:undecaprenyl-diphosphate phosphatase [Oscillospiraceae bacterium]